jgi:hypothetical protein
LQLQLDQLTPLQIMFLNIWLKTGSELQALPFASFSQTSAEFDELNYTWL